MKSRKKNELKRNNRWKWMAGATAATAAGVSTSQGGLVTISLTNNFISGYGNNLNADLTGDGHPDLTIVGVAYQVTHRYFTTSKGGMGYYRSFDKTRAQAILNGVFAGAYFSHDYGFGTVQLGSKIGHFYRSSGTPSLTSSIPIFFKDLHINGGSPTEGSLEVTVAYGTVQLDSFTYNSDTPAAGSRVAAVPDQGSSLALLAMGAGGVLALRRRRTAQGQC